MPYPIQLTIFHADDEEREAEMMKKEKLNGLMIMKVVFLRSKFIKVLSDQ